MVFKGKIRALFSKLEIKRDRYGRLYTTWDMAETGQRIREVYAVG